MEAKKSVAWYKNMASITLPWICKRFISGIGVVNWGARGLQPPCYFWTNQDTLIEQSITLMKHQGSSYGKFMEQIASNGFGVEDLYFCIVLNITNTGNFFNFKLIDFLMQTSALRVHLIHDVCKRHIILCLQMIQRCFVL